MKKLCVLAILVTASGVGLAHFAIRPHNAAPRGGENVLPERVASAEDRSAAAAASDNSQPMEAEQGPRLAPNERTVSGAPPALPVMQVPSGAEQVPVDGSSSEPRPELAVVTSSGKELAVPSAEPPGGQPARIPAALAERSPALNFSSFQLEKLALLEEEFARNVGGPRQDPSSPEYRTRWDAALADSDRRFILFFGRRAYVAQNLKARHNATGMMTQ